MESAIVLREKDIRTSLHVPGAIFTSGKTAGITILERIGDGDNYSRPMKVIRERIDGGDVQKPPSGELVT